jgi:hypothetical protein
LKKEAKTFFPFWVFLKDDLRLHGGRRRHRCCPAFGGPFGSPARLRLFNLTMGLLLAASVIPAVLE